MKAIKEQDLKHICVGILSEFDTICGQYNLVYSIAYGTLLGAVRHGGFIPWDDDIDVIMPRKDYERLLNIKFNTKEFEIKNYRYTADYYYVYSKMIDKRTKIIEKYRSDKNMGVFIDIFPVDFFDSLDDLRLDTNDLSKNKKLADYCGFNSSISLASSLGKGIAKKMYRGITFPFRNKILHDLDHKCTNYKGNNFGQIVYSIYGEKDIHPTYLWKDLIIYKFEDINVKGFKNYDKYLSDIYGDYMKLPPESQRITHHDFEAFYE